jgi:hypothetical protein
VVEEVPQQTTLTTKSGFVQFLLHGSLQQETGGGGEKGVGPIPLEGEQTETNNQRQTNKEFETDGNGVVTNTSRPQERSKPTRGTITLLLLLIPSVCGGISAMMVSSITPWLPTKRNAPSRKNGKSKKSKKRNFESLFFLESSWNTHGHQSDAELSRFSVIMTYNQQRELQNITNAVPES